MSKKKIALIVTGCILLLLVLVTISIFTKEANPSITQKVELAASKNEEIKKLYDELKSDGSFTLYESFIVIKKLNQLNEEGRLKK